MTTPIKGIPLSPEMQAQLLLSHYQNSQQSIAQRAALAIYNLWLRMIDPEHFNDGWNRLDPLVKGIMATHYSATAANAAQYYANARVTAGYDHFAVPGSQPDMNYIGNVADAMGPGQFYHFLQENDPHASSAMANDALRGASTRMVMMGGRDTITNAVHIDPRARGWERVIEPGACGFCAMLAGRGAVYKESTVDFRAHDHCHCTARAVFVGQGSVNDALSAEWGTATKGTSGKQAIRTWNKYWESRNGGSQATSGSSEEGSGTTAVAKESVQRSALPH
jgi:hypothetical protein